MRFMDEGFNTFIDIGESAEFQGGVYGPKRDSEYSAGGEPPDTILKVLDDPAAPMLLMPADAYTVPITHPVSYFKGAYGMVLLREQILGKERFDWAFRKYIRDWAYKHPSPSDFFRDDEQRGRRGSGLVLARLVHAQLALRPGGHQDRGRSSDAGEQRTARAAGNRGGAIHRRYDYALPLAGRDLGI